jgi:hypothetical protein
MTDEAPLTQGLLAPRRRRSPAGRRHSCLFCRESRRQSASIAFVTGTCAFAKSGDIAPQCSAARSLCSGHFRMRPQDEISIGAQRGPTARTRPIGLWRTLGARDKETHEAGGEAAAATRGGPSVVDDRCGQALGRHRRTGAACFGIGLRAGGAGIGRLGGGLCTHVQPQGVRPRAAALAGTSCDAWRIDAPCDRSMSVVRMSST